MPTSTFVLANSTPTDFNFDLAGVTASGAVWKDDNRELSLPRDLTVDYKIGQPGSKGNNTMNITLRDAVRNSTTGVVSIGSVKVICSLPRDAAWTDVHTLNVITLMKNFLATAGVAASVTDGLVP